MPDSWTVMVHWTLKPKQALKHSSFHTRVLEQRFRKKCVEGRSFQPRAVSNQEKKNLSRQYKTYWFSIRCSHQPVYTLPWRIKGLGLFFCEASIRYPLFWSLSYGLCNSTAIMQPLFTLYFHLKRTPRPCNPLPLCDSTCGVLKNTLINAAF